MSASGDSLRSSTPNVIPFLSTELQNCLKSADQDSTNGFNDPRPEGDSDLDFQIMENTQYIAIEFPGYGCIGIMIELQNRSYSVKEKIFGKYMKEDNLLYV